MNIQRPQSKQPIPEHATLAFKGKIFDVYQWQQEMYDGSTKTFEKVKRPDTVVIYPVLEDGTILITEQVQPGREAFIDLPSGMVDEGEDPLVAAKRELLEETGYEAQEYVLWDAITPMAKIEWVVYSFIAKKCKKVREQEVDSGEKVALKKVSFNELLQCAHNPNFRAFEAIPPFLKAQISKEKYAELKELFKPL
jgi:ADP-ribose pyrophosphatase